MAIKLKGQGSMGPELVGMVLGFAVLVGIAVYVLSATITAVPQNTAYSNETVKAAGLWTNTTNSEEAGNGRLYSVTNGPICLGSTVSVFNGTTGVALTETANFMANDTSSVYIMNNATGNTTNALTVSYTHCEFGDTSAQTTIDNTNTNWANAMTLVAIAIIVLAAGAILYTTRTGFGG